MITSFHSGNFFHDRLRAASSRLFWLGFIMVLLGLGAIAFPIFSTLAATILVGWALLISGVAIFISSFWIPASGWLGMLLSGLASIALAIIIASGWPGISVFVLGLLLGINFLTTGLGYIFISRAFKVASTA
jgi:uncharacterized membrane protein HdeD (DUF308 family)